MKKEKLAQWTLVEKTPRRYINTHTYSTCHVQGNSGFVQNDSGVKTACHAKVTYASKLPLSGGGGGALTCRTG